MEEGKTVYNINIGRGLWVGGGREGQLSALLGRDTKTGRTGCDTLKSII